MSSRDFCYWLQGFFELSATANLDKDQTLVIKNHLHMVFKHEIDPSAGSVHHQEELNDIHNNTIVRC